MQILQDRLGSGVVQAQGDRAGLSKELICQLCLVYLLSAQCEQRHAIGFDEHNRS